jgi:hypothetical protein
MIEALESANPHQFPFRVVAGCIVPGEIPVMFQVLGDMDVRSGV